MNKRVVFFLATALGALLIGMFPLFASITVAPAASSTDATWKLAPTNPEYLDYIADLAAGEKVSPIMPPQVDFIALATQGQIPSSPFPPPPTPENPGFFPSAYDLRTLGRVTPARVSDCGACWTFATYGSLESFLAPFEIWDFSEDHLQLERAFDYPVCGAGGHAEEATRYLSAWRGPVKEHDYSYNSETPQNTPVQKHVQQVFYLPNRQTPLDNDWVKLSLMLYGGVYSSSSWTYGYNFATDAYYNPTWGSGHAVTIVGWDDNFDRNKFFCNDPDATEDQKIPPGNGAFIVKNNQGPSLGENGFHYVSYYDKGIGTSMAVFTAEPASNYNRIYQHDPLGVTDYLTGGYFEIPTFAANVFTAMADDNLTAVSFFNVEPQDPVDYQIRVYLDPPDGAPCSPDTVPVASVKVSLILPGYYTVKLPDKIPLRQGQRFSVVLVGIMKQNGHGYGAQVAIERPSLLKGYSQATGNAGESYVSLHGESWQDLTTVEVYDQGNMVPLENTNVCIKAFTTPKVSFSAWKAEGLAKYLVWSFLNDSTTATTVKPVAQLFHKTKRGFSRFGGEVTADYYLDASGVKHHIKGGWVQVSPGETITAYSKRGALDKADRVAYSYYTDLPTDNLKSRRIMLSEVWRNFLLFESPLHVVSTTPMSGENVNSPLSIITVNFDKEIKPGPSLHNINVMSVGSPSETKMTYNSVGGNTLYIALTSPIYISQAPGSGEILWRVHLPSDAVTDQSGNPLDQDYSWSFTSGLAW